MKGFSRRQFLKTAAMTAAGAAIVPGSITQANAAGGLSLTDATGKLSPANPNGAQADGAAVLTDAADSSSEAGAVSRREAKLLRQNWFNYTSADGVQTLSIWSPWIKEDIHLFVIADSHLYESDSRNEPYKAFSARMAAAYNQVPHHVTHRMTTPAQSFREVMETAKRKRPDAIIHLGDLVSFPSELSIEYAASLIKECGLPFYYISGNHDWCYEGFEADPFKHRATWMPRLRPLYPEGVDPLGYTKTVKGLKLILLDDSTNDVTPDQVEFFRKEVSCGMPTLLMMHIGLYLPGHETYYLGYPDYKPVLSAAEGLQMRSAKDPAIRASNIEALFREVMRASDSEQLLATVVGHNHVVKTEEIALSRQFVVPFAGNGSYTDLYLHPSGSAE